MSRKYLDMTWPEIYNYIYIILKGLFKEHWISTKVFCGLDNVNSFNWQMCSDVLAVKLFKWFCFCFQRTRHSKNSNIDRQSSTWLVIWCSPTLLWDVNQICTWYHIFTFTYCMYFVLTYFFFSITSYDIRKILFKILSLV